MEPILDVFRSDAFSFVTLTDSINKLPFVPGRLGALGLFTESRCRAPVLKVPHYQLDDNVLAEEVQNVREFGPQMQPRSVETYLSSRMEVHRPARRHDRVPAGGRHQGPDRRPRRQHHLRPLFRIRGHRSRSSTSP